MEQTTHPDQPTLTFGLVLELIDVLDRHSFGSLDEHSPLELAVHLGHYLNGNEEDRCWGRCR